MPLRKLKLEYKVTCCADCPFTGKEWEGYCSTIDDEWTTCNIGSDVESKSEKDPMPNDCPLRSHVYTVKL